MIEIKIDTLYEAIEKKVNINLKRAEENREALHFSSRFLHYDLEEKTIAIAFPRASSDLADLKRSDRIVVGFIYKESPFTFNSSVVGVVPVGIPGEQYQPAMAIALPGAIFGDERRDFLKVSTPAFVVDLQVIDSQDIVKKLQGKRFNAAAVNISGGGIALENKEKELPLALGDFLDLYIHFPGEKIHLEGEVKNIYQFGNSRKTVFGIMFMPRTLDKLSFQKSIRSITRYVMKRERELLTK